MPDPSTATDDRRGESRVPLNERLIVKVNSAPGHPDLEGLSCSGATRNASDHGLQVISPVAVGIGDMLGLWVKVDGHPGTFMLSGEVRWCKPYTDSGPFELGVHLVERPGDDNAAWVHLCTQSYPTEA